ncbi:type IV conjugative transfer system lipoprotein TraV [Pseudomonas asiatica]|uniref:type IV conjugative transfer system lipoprotein TraV n=1 Tax=Pseudomonas TaxID=286 RepID=UPI001BAE980C|nr:type IV conjugative transfer system lipoprotein TraV [Pseudomonas putida]
MKIMNLKVLRTALFAGLVANMTGCTLLQVGESEYGCKGMPNGVTCMSARDVYQLTENENFRQEVEAQSAVKGEGDGGSKQDVTATPAAPSVAVGERYVVPRPARNPIPIRSQATVMRVWVAPWENGDGDLIVPGYMYTEIEPRRWEIGVPAPRPTPSIRPLESRKTPPAQQAN